MPNDPSKAAGRMISVPRNSASAAEESFHLAHSLLISRFLSPSIPHLDADVRELAAWAAALKENVDSAIRRFKQTNLLIPFTPSTVEELKEGLDRIYGVQQLKEMLRSRAQKLTGRKHELIARLIDADRDAMSREISALGLYNCSSAGKHLAARFEERKQQACAAAVAAINTGQYASAIDEYKQLEDDLGFPKWEFEVRPTPKFIEFVMTVKPKILEGCSDSVMNQLRLSMALQCLAGRHAPKNVLHDLHTGIRLDADTAARMIYFLARHKEDMETWRQMRITHIKHLASSDSCISCTSLNGREYRVNLAPELPHSECTNDYGCRCLYQPVLNF